jgi:P4 family phage/plasmid primase-like protien
VIRFPRWGGSIIMPREKEEKTADNRNEKHTSKPLNLSKEDVSFHLDVIGTEKRDKIHIVAKNHKSGGVQNFWKARNEIFELAKDLNGKGYTVWISLNTKEIKIDKIEGISHLDDLWFDLDARPKEVKDRVATKEELGACLKQTERLYNYIKETYGADGFIAYSGNGFHLHYPLSHIPLFGRAFRKEVNEKVNRFVKQITDKAGMEVDHTSDLRRVTTIIGSYNLKIADEPLLTKWDKSSKVSKERIEEIRGQNTGLVETIFNTNTDAGTKGKEDASDGEGIDDDFKDRVSNLLKNNKKFSDLMEGKWESYGYASRSEAEQAVLTILAREGFNDVEILKVMIRCKIGRWQESKDSYKAYSIGKAREYTKDEGRDGKDRTGSNKNKDFFIRDKDGNVKSVDFNALIKDIMASISFKTTRDNGTIYYQNNGDGDGCYHQDGEEIIREETQRRIDLWAKPSIKDFVIDQIKDQTRINRSEINKRWDLLPLQNEMIDLRLFKLIEEDDVNDDLIFTYRLPVKYNADADCPEIKKFLNEVFKNAEDEIDVVQELFGYCLWADPYQPAQVGSWWYGSGANGKTQLGNLLTHFLGDENVSVTSIHSLEYNRFSLINLAGKLANIASEAGSMSLNRSETYKKLTGGDLVELEQKFKKAYTDRLPAKLITYSNKFPEIKDDSYAFWRRPIILKFPNRFEGDDKEEKIAEKLASSEEEMSGLLNWAFEGLKRLREKHWQFSHSKTIEETKTEFMMASNPFEAFYRKRCVEDPTGRESTRRLYKAFSAFCEENDINIEYYIANKFGRKLSNKPLLENDRWKEGGHTVVGWNGIRLISISDDVSNDEVTEVTAVTDHSTLFSYEAPKDSTKFIDNSKEIGSTKSVTPITSVTASFDCDEKNQSTSKTSKTFTGRISGIEDDHGHFSSDDLTDQIYYWAKKHFGYATHWSFSSLCDVFSNIPKEKLRSELLAMILQNRIKLVRSSSGWEGGAEGDAEFQMKGT